MTAGGKGKSAASRLAKHLNRMTKRQDTTQLIDPDSLISRTLQKNSSITGKSLFNQIPRYQPIAELMGRTVPYRTAVKLLPDPQRELLKSIDQTGLCNAKFQPSLSSIATPLLPSLLHRVKGSAKTPTELQYAFMSSFDKQQPLVLIFGMDNSTATVTGLRHALVSANLPSSPVGINYKLSSSSSLRSNNNGANIFHSAHCILVELPNLNNIHSGSNEKENNLLISQPLTSWNEWMDAALMAGAGSTGRYKRRQRRIIPLMVLDARLKEMSGLHRQIIEYFNDRLSMPIHLIFTQCERSDSEMLARQLTMARWILDGDASLSADGSAVTLHNQQNNADDHSRSKLFACSHVTGAGIWPLKQWLAGELGLNLADPVVENTANIELDPLTPDSRDGTDDDGRDRREKFRLRPFSKTQSRGPGIHKRIQRQHMRKNNK